MQDLSLHILDIAENSLAAGAHTITIDVREDPGRDLLTIVLTDDGRGMDAVAASRAADPFYTTRTTRRVGLGLALLHEAADTAGGSMTVQSAPGEGTTVRAEFQLSHVDRKPLGDMADTVTALVAAHADVRIRYSHVRGQKSFVFDTAEIRRATDDAALDTAAALSVIRNHLRREESAIAG